MQRATRTSALHTHKTASSKAPAHSLPLGRGGFFLFRSSFQPSAVVATPAFCKRMQIRQDSRWRSRDGGGLSVFEVELFFSLLPFESSSQLDISFLCHDCLERICRLRRKLCTYARGSDVSASFFDPEWITLSSVCVSQRPKYPGPELHIPEFSFHSTSVNRNHE